MAQETEKKPVSTSTLLSGIFKTPSLEPFLERNEEQLHVPTLPEHLDALCRARGLLRVEAIRRSGIDRSFGFQIFQGTKNPSRDKLLQIALGIGLSYEETQELLRIAHKSALYPRIRRDAALIYCLNRHRSVTDTQAILSELGVPILGREAEA